MSSQNVRDALESREEESGSPAVHFHPGSVSRQSEGPFMGRLREGFGRLAHSMQNTRSKNDK